MSVCAICPSGREKIFRLLLHLGGGRRFLLPATLFHLLAERAGILAAKGLRDGYVDRILARIVLEHSCPGNGLQNCPMPACQVKHREADQRQPECTDHFAAPVDSSPSLFCETRRRVESFPIATDFDMTSMTASVVLGPLCRTNRQQHVTLLRRGCCEPHQAAYYLPFSMFFGIFLGVTNRRLYFAWSGASKMPIMSRIDNIFVLVFTGYNRIYRHPCSSSRLARSSRARPTPIICW